MIVFTQGGGWVVHTSVAVNITHTDGGMEIFLYQPYAKFIYDESIAIVDYSLTFNFQLQRRYLFCLTFKEQRSFRI